MSNIHINGMSGAQVRAARREFNPKVFSRRSADAVITATTDIALIKRFAEFHPNKHVVRHATHRALKLESGLMSPVVTEAVSEAITEPADLPVNEELVNDQLVMEPPTPPKETLEFDRLVARFTAEGKKDPIKSARASIAASAQAAKRAEQKKALGAMS